MKRYLGMIGCGLGVALVVLSRTGILAPSNAGAFLPEPCTCVILGIWVSFFTLLKNMNV